jgi:hypothetical protein
MADPFGDQDQSPGGAGKRPAPTIEGTATELSVEPAVDDADPAASGSAEAGSADPEPEPQDQDEGEEGQAYIAGRAAESDPAEFGHPPAHASLSELKSFVTHLAAGLLGGLVGVVALAFAWGGLPGGKAVGPAPDVTKLEQRVAKLEGAPASSGDAEAVAQLDTRIKALEGSAKEASPELAGLTSRVAQLETQLKAVAEAAKEGGSVADAAAISQQIADAEQRLQAKIDAALAGGEGANASTIQDMQGEIAELKAKIGALADAELGTGDTTDLEPQMAALSDRMAKLESALSSKETAGTKSAAVAIAFANLKGAVSEGRPFATELATINSLSPSAGDLGVLPAYAEKGIPTLPELTRSFRSSKDAALAAAAPASDGSILANLMASASSLVKIRRVDEAATGEGPGAVLARAEAVLDKGNLAGSVKEVETLDGAPRDAFSVWLDQAHARLGADGILKQLEGLLLVSVGGGAEPAKP